MNKWRRITKWGLVALLVSSVVGCCVVPPRGWGHVRYGYGGYEHPRGR